MSAFGNLFFAALLLIFLSLSSFASGANRELVSSGNRNYPPSSWEEGGRIVGVASDLLEKILEPLGVRVKSKNFGPWGRVQLYARRGRIDLVTTIYKTEARETYLSYVPTPYMDDPNVIWVPRGKAFPFRQWSDLIGRRGTAVIGDSYGEDFDLFIEKNLSVDRVTKLELNFKKLASGRADYMPYGYYSGLVVARQLGYEDQIEYLPVPLLSVPLYFALSKNSEFIELIPQIDEGVRRYREDGTVEALIRKHLDRFIEAEGDKRDASE